MDPFETPPATQSSVDPFGTPTATPRPAVDVADFVNAFRSDLRGTALSCRADAARRARAHRVADMRKPRAQRIEERRAEAERAAAEREAQCEAKRAGRRWEQEAEHAAHIAQARRGRSRQCREARRAAERKAARATARGARPSGGGGTGVCAVGFPDVICRGEHEVERFDASRRSEECETCKAKLWAAETFEGDVLLCRQGVAGAFPGSSGPAAEAVLDTWARDDRQPGSSEVRARSPARWHSPLRQRGSRSLRAADGRLLCYQVRLTSTSALEQRRPCYSRCTFWTTTSRSR